jgi:hypothetical protein
VTTPDLDLQGPSPASSAAMGARTRAGWVRAVQVALGLTVALSIPTGVVAAFRYAADRNATGDCVAVCFLASLLLLLSTPWWPAGLQRTRTFDQRLQSTCMIWFGFTFATHLSWELLWLLFHQAIIGAPNEPWAFAWWMYIDGGDRRYATSDPTILTLETLSVLNGVLGASALWLRRRSRSTSPVATLMLMATGIVHIYSTAWYLLSESIGGYPNVDTASFVDLWLKFGLLNGVWLAMPWLVFLWGTRTLAAQLRAA